MTDAERMAELMRYANAAAVGKALGVSRQTAAQWAKGLDVNPTRLRQVEDLLRPSGPDDLPDWVKRLLEGMFALERKAGITERELAEAQAQVAAFRAASQSGPPRLAGGGGRGLATASAGRPSNVLRARRGR